MSICENKNVFFTLLPPHFGKLFIHFPDDKHVLDPDPTTLYPLLHEKVATVLGG